MYLRSVLALLVTPIVAGAIPTLFYLLDSTPGRIGLREWIQVAAWVLLTIIFELVVLLPVTRLLRNSKYFRLWLLLAGVVAWLLISLVWLVVVFHASATEAVAPLLRMGLAGLAVCGTFVLLWLRPSLKGVPGSSDA
jgi:hypothetical protein